MPHTQKIATGIRGFDALLHGGLLRGRTCLIAGEPGTGKTIFSLQYLIEGAKNGEKCVYISIDEQPHHIVADALSLGWDLGPFLKNGTFKILDVTKYFESSKFRSTDGINTLEIIEDITRFVAKESVTRLVIDPVAPLIFNAIALPEISEYIRTLILRLETESHCTTLFTSHVPVGSNQYSQHGVEEFAASGIVLLRLTPIQHTLTRTLSVRKMRGSQTELTEMRFDIVKEHGVVLHPIS